jgi:hypothetical protein
VAVDHDARIGDLDAQLELIFLALQARGILGVGRDFAAAGLTESGAGETGDGTGDQPRDAAVQRGLDITDETHARGNRKRKHAGFRVAQSGSQRDIALLDDRSAEELVSRRES